ncbi:hypothetical protein J6590_066044 [Homalodisca vitripennis]|nr:hypothetical protein J6590_066044 [Homalodisca vitripennis]
MKAPQRVAGISEHTYSQAPCQVSIFSSIISYYSTGTMSCNLLQFVKYQSILTLQAPCQLSIFLQFVSTTREYLLYRHHAPCHVTFFSSLSSIRAYLLCRHHVNCPYFSSLSAPPENTYSTGTMSGIQSSQYHIILTLQAPCHVTFSSLSSIRAYLLCRHHVNCPYFSSLSTPENTYSTGTMSGIQSSPVSYHTYSTGTMPCNLLQFVKYQSILTLQAPCQLSIFLQFVSTTREYLLYRHHAPCHVTFSSLSSIRAYLLCRHLVNCPYFSSLSAPPENTYSTGTMSGIQSSPASYHTYSTGTMPCNLLQFVKYQSILTLQAPCQLSIFLQFVSTTREYLLYRHHVRYPVFSSIISYLLYRHHVRYPFFSSIISYLLYRHHVMYLLQFVKYQSILTLQAPCQLSIFLQFVSTTREYLLYRHHVRYPVFSSIISYLLYRHHVRYPFFSSIISYLLYRHHVMYPFFSNIISYSLYRHHVRYPFFSSTMSGIHSSPVSYHTHSTGTMSCNLLQFVKYQSILTLQELCKCLDFFSVLISEHTYSAGTVSTVHISPEVLASLNKGVPPLPSLTGEAGSELASPSSGDT